MSKKNYLYLIGLILLFLLAGLAFLITNEVSLNAATTPKLGPPITPNLTPKGPGTPYTPIVGTPIASGANGKWVSLIWATGYSAANDHKQC